MAEAICQMTSVEMPHRKILLTGPVRRTAIRVLDAQLYCVCRGLPKSLAHASQDVDGLKTL